MSDSNQDKPLLVIGAGCGRTGTASLKRALEILLKRPCYHMFQMIDHHPDHPEKWIELDRQITESKRPGGSPVDIQLIRQLLHGYGAAVDFPAAAYYSYIMQAYPDAKVILTVRDTRSWIQSARSTIFAHDNYDPPWYVRWFPSFVTPHATDIVAQRSFEHTFGGNVFQMDDEQLGRAFDQWNSDVQSKVQQERLLVFHVQDGWEPLCKFLQLDIPTESFPYANDREEFQRRVNPSGRSPVVIGLGVPVVLAMLTVGIGVLLHHR